MNKIAPRLLPALLVLALASVAQAKVPVRDQTDRPATVSESEAATYWQPKSPMTEPALPVSAPDASEDVCVSLGYMVKADGTTSDYALLRSWGSKHPRGIPDSAAYSVYSRTAVAATMQHSFTAAPSMAAKPVSIFTATTFAFPAAGGDRAAVRARCAIANLPDFVRRAQEDSYRRRGDLNKGRVDRAQVMRGTGI
ncbi:hypothetical protein BH11PSE14_BH11PSE14_06660 [soil metagenome]